MAPRREKFAAQGELNLICGAGGSRAILGSSGVILATHAAGIESWRSIGGVSGGSIPSLMLAAGVSPAEIIRKVIEIDFNSMLTARTNMAQIWWAFFLKECAWKRRTERGVLTAEKLGDLAEHYAAQWPENYWTVAVAGYRQFLFTAKGVYEYSAESGKRLVWEQPMPIGLAIRATCAVPGVIDAVRYRGMSLLDGALCDEGRCPVVVARDQLGAAPETIVACDVGEGAVEAMRREHWLFKAVRRVACGPCCDPEEGPPVDTSGGVTLVTPSVTKVEALEFALSPDQKWESVMAGFSATARSLQKSGLVAQANLVKALAVAREFDFIQQAAVEPGELAGAVRTLLGNAGLVEL